MPPDSADLTASGPGRLQADRLSLALPVTATTATLAVAVVVVCHYCHSGSGSSGRLSGESESPAAADLRRVPGTPRLPLSTVASLKQRSV